MIAKNLIPAVSYVRMSTDRQEESPDQQRAEIARLAERGGYKILREYYDKGISGDATEKRVQFKKMIRDAEQARDFNAILCWDQDRFGRFDSLEAGKWIEPLRDAEVVLVTLAQGEIDWNSFEGRIVFGVTQEAKHQFLHDLSRNVLRGLVKSCESGNHFGMAPYGYDRVFYDATGAEVYRAKPSDGFRKPRNWSVKLTPSDDPQVVSTVRWIYDTYVGTDTTTRQLAIQLNRRGVASPAGCMWHARQVWWMLQNPVYVGTLTFGRKNRGKYNKLGVDGSIVKAKAKTDSGTIIVENNHPPLVERETFDAVQRKFQDRSQHNLKPTPNAYPLSGLVHCGHCGRRMRGQTARSKGKVYRYYRCPTADFTTGTGSDGCRNYCIRAEMLEHYLIRPVKQQLLDADGKESLRAEILAEIERQSMPATDVIKSLTNNLAMLESEIKQGARALLLAKPEDMQEASVLLAEWRAKRDALKSELDRLAKQQSGDSTAERLCNAAMKKLNRIEANLKSADPALLRHTYKQFFSKIELWFRPVGRRYFLLSTGLVHFNTLNVLSDVGCSGSCTPGEAATSTT